ncbi:rhomboid family intramembrane serine protease [Xanthomonas oryzae]|uniref:rhomboid family intramembrane serine protease n=1 Tax=Xanthomonas oryzae TaxID=347 RepID=UPI000A4A031B|nr:rhomboid family intramembrane serine protease [Xanthomonas oryzae]
MLWKSDESFPRASDRWSAWRPTWGRRLEGESAVRRAIWQWHPFDTIIVSVAGEKSMLPPICFARMAPQIQKRMLLQYFLLFSLMLCMTLGFTIASAMAHDVYFIKASAAIILFLIFLILQYIFIFRKLSNLCEYSGFFAWCYLQPSAQTLSITSMMIAIGGVQVYLQMHAGSLFRLIEQYGLVFQDAPRQPWRYLSGPFLHSGIAHWAANFSLLMIAAGLSFSLGRAPFIWLTFLSGIILPAFLLTFLPHWVGSDAFLGISGGVFSLYGWIAGIWLRTRRIFPPHLWVVNCLFRIGNDADFLITHPTYELVCTCIGLAAGACDWLIGDRIQA